MALQNGRVQAPPKGSRAACEATYTTCRSNLLLAAAITLLNVVLALVGSNTYFLFSASVPYYVAAFGRLFFDEYGFFADVIIGGVIAVVLTGLYFVFWVMTKRHRKWMIGAAVYFALDCLGLILLTLDLGFEFRDIIDYLFHVYVMYYLVTGSIAALKLAKMPPEDPIAVEADAPQMRNETPAEDIPAEQAPAKDPAEAESAEETPVEETQSAE